MSSDNDFKPVQVLLYWKGNLVKERPSKFKAPSLDKDGNVELFPRKNWIAVIGPDGKYTNWLNNEGEALDLRMYKSKITECKIKYVITEDGSYAAEEADKFNQYETIKHAFTVKDGIITEGSSKKGSNGEQIASGFCLEHINSDGSLVNRKIMAEKPFQKASNYS